METWARAARRACSDCGRPVKWTTAIDLPWRVPAGLSEEGQLERRRMWHAINWCGADAEAWWCAACGNWGVFTDSERVL